MTVVYCSFLLFFECWRCSVRWNLLHFRVLVCAGYNPLIICWRATTMTLYVWVFVGANTRSMRAWSPTRRTWLSPCCSWTLWKGQLCQRCLVFVAFYISVLRFHEIRPLFSLSLSLSLIFEFVLDSGQIFDHCFLERTQKTYKKGMFPRSWLVSRVGSTRKLRDFTHTHAHTMNKVKTSKQANKQTSKQQQQQFV